MRSPVRLALRSAGATDAYQKARPETMSERTERTGGQFQAGLLSVLGLGDFIQTEYIRSSFVQALRGGAVCGSCLQWNHQAAEMMQCGDGENNEPSTRRTHISPEIRHSTRTLALYGC